MTDTSVSEVFLEYVESSPNWDLDGAFEFLRRKGFSETMVDDALRFVPVAFGRVLLDGMGIQFSNQYYIFEADGSLTDSGVLTHQTIYNQAVNTALGSRNRHGFRALALHSAEVNAVNNALNAGSSPAGLRAGPVVSFVGEPTQEGMQRVQHYLSPSGPSAAEGKDASEEPSPESKSPWWKFW